MTPYRQMDGYRDLGAEPSKEQTADKASLDYHFSSALSMDSEVSFSFMRRGFILPGSDSYPQFLGLKVAVPNSNEVEQSIQPER